MFVGATRAARGCLHTLTVPGDAGITRGAIVTACRANRESLRRVVALSGERDANKGFWTPKHVHEAISAAGPKLVSFAVDVRARAACVALTQQLTSPVVRVRHLDVRAGANAFGAEDKARLFSAVATLRAKNYPRGELKRITLASCGLNAEDCLKLVSAICGDNDECVNGDKNLELDVGENPGIGCRGAAILAKAVADGTLGSLRVENCGIGETGAAALGNALASPRCALTSLLIARNFLGAAGIASVADGLVRRTKQFSGGEKIKRLDLGHNSFGCLGAAALEMCARTSHAFENLEVLDVSNNGMGPSGIAALARGMFVARRDSKLGTPNLSELNLEGNPIGAAGARAVARASLAVDDEMEGTAVSNHAASLRMLGLGSTRLGVVGAAAVAWAIKQNGTLSNVVALDLSANDIGESGAALNVSGRDVVFGGCEYGEDIEGIKDTDIENDTMDASNSSSVYSPRDESALASLAFDLASAPALRSLDLGYNSLGCVGACIIAEAVASRKIDGVFMLDLRRNSIGDTGANALASALSSSCATATDFLSSVDLRSNAIGEAGLEALRTHVASGRVASNYMPTRWSSPREVAPVEETELKDVGRAGGREESAAEVEVAA